MIQVGAVQRPQKDGYSGKSTDLGVQRSMNPSSALSLWESYLTSLGSGVSCRRAETTVNHPVCLPAVQHSGQMPFSAFLALDYDMTEFWSEECDQCNVGHLQAKPIRTSHGLSLLVFPLLV